MKQKTEKYRLICRHNRDRECARATKPNPTPMNDFVDGEGGDYRLTGRRERVRMRINAFNQPYWITNE